MTRYETMGGWQPLKDMLFGKTGVRAVLPNLLYYRVSHFYLVLFLLLLIDM